MREIALELAKQQKEISVAEFFERNRHLLGFDNKKKALLTVTKEAVDNALDACEDAGVLPELKVEIIELGSERYRVCVEDNGPGIVKEQIPRIFGKLLYGSRFHKICQSRGQQGIGISAAVLYSQLTTAKPAKVLSKIDPSEPAWLFELGIDVKANEPVVFKHAQTEWQKPHGTRIELELEGSYAKGEQSVDAYLKQTAIVNPHATIFYLSPKGESTVFARCSDSLPKKPKAIKPHPYGLELGALKKMLQSSSCRSLQSFLVNEFSRVGPRTAKEICARAGILPSTKPGALSQLQCEALMQAIGQTKIIAPSTDCIVAIGQDFEKGLRKELDAEFFCYAIRQPETYRGIPFTIEAALGYGGQEQARLLRFANRVPLLYQQSACALYRAATQVNWKAYGLGQNGLPIGPVTIAIHFVSAWPPFTNEAKEAIAHYPEIIKAAKLVLQELGRKLAVYIHRKQRVKAERLKRSYIERYIPHIASAIGELIEISAKEQERLKGLLRELLERHRGKIEELELAKK